VSAFEDCLWTYLVREHPEVLTQSARWTRPVRPGQRRWGQSRPSAFAAAGASIAAAAIATFVVVGVRNATPAYAVTQNSDGTVTITLRELSGVDALNARLAQLGVRVHALLADSSCTVTTQELEWNALYAQIVTANGPAPEVTIQPSAIPADDTLLLAVGPAPNGQGPTARLMLISGTAPSCIGDVLKPVRVPVPNAAALALRHLGAPRVRLTSDRPRALARSRAEAALRHQSVRKHQGSDSSLPSG
jgi:hypothetical protein